MTTPKPPVDLDDFLADIAAEAEADRLAKLSPEELAKALEAEGIDSAAAQEAVRKGIELAKAEEAKAAPAEAAKVVDLGAARAKRRGLPLVTWGLVAAAAAALVVGVLEREEVVAWFSPPAVPTATGVPPVHEPTPEEKAEHLRQEAFVKVQEGYYGEAEDALDEAKALDPIRDQTPAVIEARQAIAMSKTQPSFFEGNAKPRLGPNERPLQRQGPRPAPSH